MSQRGIVEVIATKGSGCDYSSVDILSHGSPLAFQDDDDVLLTILAEEWKKLSDKDRACWDEESRNDKVR